MLRTPHPKAAPPEVIDRPAEMESTEMVKSLYLHMVDAQQRAEHAPSILNWMHWNTVANSLRRSIQERLAAEGAQAETAVWS
jgi:hypothetical protein